MKKHFFVGVSVIAAAGALIVQTTPVQASTLASIAGNPLPKFGGGDQQWLIAAGQPASGFIDIIGSAVSSVVIGTPAAIAGAAANSASGPWTEPGEDDLVAAVDCYSSTSSSATDSSGSGGTIAHFGAAASPVYDHVGVVQNPGGTVSQPGPGTLPAGKLAKISATRLD